MAHLKSVLDRQLALGSSLVDNFDFSDSVDLNFISSVRHPVHDILVNIVNGILDDEGDVLFLF